MRHLRIVRDRFEVDGTQSGEVAQAKCLVDALHDPLAALPLLDILRQVGVQTLCQVDVEALRFSRFVRQPAPGRLRHMRTALTTPAIQAPLRPMQDLVVFQGIERIVLLRRERLDRRPQAGQAVAVVGRLRFEQPQLRKEIP